MDNAIIPGLDEIVDLRSLSQRLMRNKLSQATNTAYRRAWEKLRGYSLSRGWEPEWVTPEQFAEFLCSLYYNDKRTVRSIRSAASAIRFRYEQNGRWSAKYGFIARNVIINLARKSAEEGTMVQAQAYGLTEACYRQIVRTSLKAAKKAKSDWMRYHILTDVALLAVMRDGLLRRIEASRLNWEDLELNIEDGSATGYLHFSKTDQTGEEGHVFYLAARTVRHLKASTPHRKGPVFISRHGRRMHDATICRRLKRAAERAGIDPSMVSGHSARVGMAQDLARDGASLVELQQVGRWKTSTMPFRYVRKISVQDNAVAKFHRRMDTHERYRSKVYPEHVEV